MSAPHNKEDDNEDQYLDPNEAEAEIEDSGDERMGSDDEEVEYREEEEGEDTPMEYILEAVDGPDPDAEEEEESQEDNSLAHSAHHDPSSSLFSISLHPLFPNPPLAISGGEDDVAFIFSPLYPSTPSSSSSPSSPQFQPIKLTGHTDSVIAASFSSDGELVASGGMDGKVRVWRRVKGKAAAAAGEVEGAVKAELESWQNWEFLTSLDTGDEITWLTWHPKGAVLAAGCNDSTVWMWQLPSGNTMQVFSSHTLPCTSGLFSPNGKLLLTTSEDSSLCIWDPRSPVPLLKLHPTSTAGYGNFGDGGITALAVSPASNLVAIGGANGAIRIINLPDGRVVNSLSGHGGGRKANAMEEDEDPQNSVEGLQFMDLLGLAGPGGEAGGTRGLVLVSCGGDGRAVVWDVTTGNPRAEVGHEDVVTSIIPHPAPNRHLFTSASADRTLKTWDARQGKLIAEHKGHAGVVNALAVGRAPEGWGVAEAEGEGEEKEEGGAIGLGKRKGAEVVVSAGDDGAVLVWRV